MEPIKLSHKVIIKADYTRKDGTNAVYIQCFYLKEKMMLPTGVYVPANFFDSKKQRIIKSHPGASSLNMIIESKLAKLSNMQADYFIRRNVPTKDEFMNDFLESSLKMDFLHYMKKQIMINNAVARQTLKHHHVVHRHMERIFRQLPFSELTAAKINLYKNELKFKTKGLKETTLANHLKIIKIYVNKAIRDGIPLQDPFKEIKIRRIQGKRVFLNREELKNLVELYFSNRLHGSAQSTLRAFLFSCLVGGIRVGDVGNLRKNQVKGNFLEFTPNKTKHIEKTVQIPIMPFARKFFSDHEYLLLGELPHPNEMNAQLKLISAITGINKRLTFHVARDTFGTNFIIAGGSVNVLMVILGHSNIKTTMIYVKLAEETEFMEVQNTLLSDYLFSKKALPEVGLTRKEVL